MMAPPCCRPACLPPMDSNVPDARCVFGSHQRLGANRYQIPTDCPHRGRLVHGPTPRREPVPDSRHSMCCRVSCWVCLARQPVHTSQQPLRVSAIFYILGTWRRPVETIAKQVGRHGGRGDGRARPSPSRDLQSASLSSSDSVATSLPLLPQLGDKFTEDELRERFDVPPQGSIRASLTSSDILLVHNMHSDCDDVEDGKRITYVGQYYDGKHDQMIGGDLKLAKSREDGRRVLYFAKRTGCLSSSALSSVSHPATRTIPCTPVRSHLSWK